VLISCWAETAAPERRQLERTLGRIALTAIDIGGNIFAHWSCGGGSNTGVPSMALS